VLELSRFLERHELPRGLKEVIARISIPKLDLAYASFLLDVGDVVEAKRVLAGVKADKGTEGDLKFLQARERALAKDVEGAAEALASDKAGGVQSRILHAEVAEKRGDLERAATDYTAVLIQSPSNALAATALARVQLRLEKYRAAIESANLAIGIDPRNWEPHRIKSEAYAALKDPQRASEERMRATSLLAVAGLRPEEVWRPEQ